MSLPTFDSQGALFGSLSSLAPGLFSETDRYKLFAQKIWPVLARTRPQLEDCYVATNGRAAFEPVVLLGTLILQFLERAPDRHAADLVRYHLGWKLALNLELGERGFHPTTLVTFRQRLLDNRQAKVAFDAVLQALQTEGLVPKRGRQRLDSTHVLGLVARLSKLECVRETLRLALEELAVVLPEAQRPDFWPLFWERYVESKLDYKSTELVLKEKQRQAGEDSWRLLRWLEPLPATVRDGRQVELLRRVFGEYYTIEAAGLAQAQKEGRELVGPAQPSAHKGSGYRAELFEVHVEARRALCPAGKENTQCSRLEEKKEGGKVTYRFALAGRGVTSQHSTKRIDFLDSYRVEWSQWHGP